MAVMDQPMAVVDQPMAVVGEPTAALGGFGQPTMLCPFLGVGGWGQTQMSWQSPRTRWYSRKVSESRIRGVHEARWRWISHVPPFPLRQAWARSGARGSLCLALVLVRGLTRDTTQRSRSTRNWRIVRYPTSMPMRQVLQAGVSDPRSGGTTNSGGTARGCQPCRKVQDSSLRQTGAIYHTSCIGCGQCYQMSDIDLLHVTIRRILKPSKRSSSRW